MFGILFKIIEWFAKGGIPAFMIQAGLTVVVFTGLDVVVGGLLDSAVNAISGLPSAALQIALLGGAADFFNITGSAILTRIALVTATKSLGLARSQ